MTDAALISCIVPVYNGERYVAETVANILEQSYRPIEALIVNDGSTDGTRAVLESFGDRIVLLDQENAGQAAARNHGLKVAKGRFIAFQDADDLWMPEKLELQMQHLSAHPEQDYCTCMMENFWDSEVEAETEQNEPVQATWQGVLARREVFERVGSLDTEVRYGDMREWMHRAKDAGVVVGHVDRVLVRRRIHANNFSRGRGELDAALMLRLAERAIARRRTPNPKS